MGGGGKGDAGGGGYTVVLAGKVGDDQFQRCKKAATFVMASGESSLQCQVHTLLPIDYELYKDKTLQENFKGKQHRANVMAFCVYPGSGLFEFIGGAQQFMGWIRQVYGYTDKGTNGMFYKRLAKVAYRNALAATGRDYVYMDIHVGQRFEGRLVIELFSDLVPKTCKNFLALCKGDGRAPDGRTLAYAKTKIHRIVKGGWIQGGDVIGGKGDDGMSIYGPTFEDESFMVKHDTVGILGMANTGRHKNGSQFYVSLDKLAWLDGRKVGFGRVIEGIRVLRALDQLETQNERPVNPAVVISACGVYKVGVDKDEE